MMIQSRPISKLSSASPRAPGEVGLRFSAIRVRRPLSEAGPVETPPHPNPPRASFARLDPARGERELSTAMLGARI
jgi:hypothetical protein